MNGFNTEKREEVHEILIMLRYCYTHTTTLLKSENERHRTSKSGGELGGLRTIRCSASRVQHAHFTMYYYYVYGRLKKNDAQTNVHRRRTAWYSCVCAPRLNKAQLIVSIGGGGGTQTPTCTRAYTHARVALTRVSAPHSSVS